MNQIRWIAFSSHDTWSQLNLFQLCSGATATFIGAACEHLRRSIDFCKRNKNGWHLCEELHCLYVTLSNWAYDVTHDIGSFIMPYQYHPEDIHEVWALQRACAELALALEVFAKAQRWWEAPLRPIFPFLCFFFISVFCGKIWDCAKLFLAPDIVAAWLMLRKCFGALFDVFFFMVFRHMWCQLQVNWRSESRFCCISQRYFPASSTFINFSIYWKKLPILWQVLEQRTMFAPLAAGGWWSSLYIAATSPATPPPTMMMMMMMMMIIIIIIITITSKMRPIAHTHTIYIYIDIYYRLHIHIIMYGF